MAEGPEAEDASGRSAVSPGVSVGRLLPIAVLISGQGTNLKAILDACAAGALAAEVRLVVSNRANAPGLAHGRHAGVPTVAIPRGDYPTRDAQHHAIVGELTRRGVELIVLAGFDQILSDELVGYFSGRIINLHPSLLPAFGGGMHAVRDALEHGVKVTGVTVHFLMAELPGVDTGPIILQESVPVLEDDTEASLLARIHRVEHRLLPAAIQLIAEGRLVIDGRRTRVLGREATDIIFRSTMG
jgi:phosphoribosylglycinamide formyltransferase 1